MIWQNSLFKLCLVVMLAVASLTFHSASVVSAQGGEIIDYGTQRNNMHSCPKGRWVVGVRVDRNELLCASSIGHSFRIAPYSEFVDGTTGFPTQRAGMHACPYNYAMTGIRVDRNLQSCARIAGGIFKEFVDGDNEPPTQRGGMHACPEGYVVTGIRVDRNYLLCGYPSVNQL